MQGSKGGLNIPKKRDFLKASKWITWVVGFAGKTPPGTSNLGSRGDRRGKEKKKKSRASSSEGYREGTQRIAKVYNRRSEKGINKKKQANGKGVREKKDATEAVAVR